MPRRFCKERKEGEGLPAGCLSKHTEATTLEEITRQQISLNLKMSLNRETRDVKQEQCSKGSDKITNSREDALLLDGERKGLVQDRGQKIMRIDATGIEAS